jgi:hypothetical protein
MQEFTNDIRTRMGSRRSVCHRHPNSSLFLLGGGMTLTINGVQWTQTPFAYLRNGKRVHNVPSYVTYQFGLAIAGEALL